MCGRSKSPIRGLPAGLEGLRLAQLSDIHLSAFLSEQELERVIDAANETRPHLALVTGDMISARGDPLDACLRQLARLRAEAGTLGCMGNHENYAGALGYATREGARLGIRFLRGQAQQLRFGGAVLNLAGVDYEPISRSHDYLAGRRAHGRARRRERAALAQPGRFPGGRAQGLRSHAERPHARRAGHGGDSGPDAEPGAFHHAFRLRALPDGTASAYVTRGIGTIGIPARIGARPEIALLRLKKARA